MHARSATDATIGTEELLTIDEAARRLALGRTTVYRLVMTAQLRSVKVGRSRRVSAASVRDYAARLAGEV